MLEYLTVLNVRVNPSKIFFGLNFMYWFTSQLIITVIMFANHLIVELKFSPAPNNKLYGCVFYSYFVRLPSVKFFKDL